VDQVLVRGLNHTRPVIVQHQIQIHPGDPVSQIAMLETQRRLYDLGIFNQVDTAIQNPDGKEPDKNILLDLREAKRYTFDYGGGLEVQTGTPAGVTAPQGQTGVSPRATFNVTRLNFLGINHSITFKSHVGRLQQRVLLSYDAPRLYNLDNLRLSFTTFYDNTVSVSTFTSRRLEGSVQAEQVIGRGTSLFYRFAYRRVQATNFAPNFNHNEVPLLSQPTRVGSPGFAYIRDHRDNPVESTRGSYNTVDTSTASSYFGSEADFSRILVQNSTYYTIKKRYVFARSTRVGVQVPFGNTLVQSPQQAAVGIPPGFTVIPLPERFFSGGGNSLRAFGLNQAGPRDLNSGFPVGGSGLFINNLELRMPPLTLPFVEDNVSFAVFQDAGNVFDSGHDMLHSLLQWQQPNQDACKNQSTYLRCDFNYVAQAVGLGIRYKTPIGPVRLDIGYNLNPPAFPSFQTVTNPITGKSSNVFTPQQLGHVNFFFSIGQTF
jgi:outer membrane protein assembly factor BamA